MTDSETPSADASILTHSTVRGVVLNRLWIGAFVAAILSWFISGRTLDVFRQPELSPETAAVVAADPYAPLPEHIGIEIATVQRAALARNTGLGFALFGAFLGCALGWSRASSSFKERLAWCSAGIALGALLGWAGGWGAVQLQPILPSSLVTSETGRVMVQQAVALSLAALGAGLALARQQGQESAVNLVLGGVVGGALAAVVHTPAAMLLFASYQHNLALPREAGARLFFLLLASSAIALGITAGIGSRSRKAAVSR